MADMKLRVKLIPDVKELVKAIKKALSLAFKGVNGETKQKEEVSPEEKKENDRKKKSDKKNNDLLSKIVKSVGIISIVSSLFSGLIDLIRPFVNLFSALSALVFFPLWKVLEPVLNDLADFISRTAKEGGGVSGFVKAGAAPTKGQLALGVPEEELPNIGTSIAGALVLAVAVAIGGAAALGIGSATIGAAIAVALAGALIIKAPALAEDIKNTIGNFWTGLLGGLLIAVGVIGLFLVGGWILALVGLLTAAVITFLPELKKFGSWLWDKITSFVSTSLDVLKNIGSFIKDKILGFFGGGNDNNTTNVTDAIITPRGQIIRTDPKDFLIATKNPSDLVNNENSGGDIIFHINNPQIRSDQDIRQLVDMIERQLAQRGIRA